LRTNAVTARVAGPASREADVIFQAVTGPHG
jgi:hypothetical protein